MKPQIDYRLYLCTDRKIMTSSTIEECIEQAILGGTTLVQLREKNCNGKDFYELAVRAKEITDAYHVPLIINDRVDVALAVSATGVHIGQSDLPCKIVRQMIPPDMIIGVSATNVSEAVKAEAEGADYLGVGAMFSTDTKTDANIVTMNELKKIRDAVSIPIVVIGGINMDTIPSFINTGINGVCVVSAIVAQKNVKKAAAELLSSFYQTLNICK